MKNFLLSLALGFGIGASALAQTSPADIGGAKVTGGIERAVSMYALDIDTIKLPAKKAVESTQQNSLTYAYDFGIKESALVGTNAVGKLRNVLNLKIDLDVDGFLGITTRSKTPLAGFFVGKRGKISEEASGYLGVGLSWPQGVQSPNFAAGAGVSWKF